MDGVKVLQLETAAGAAIRVFHKDEINYKFVVLEILLNFNVLQFFPLLNSFLIMQLV